MTGWGPTRAITIGGLVAVGFLDEQRVVVGSHSGLGIFDSGDGARLDRVVDADGSYGWFRDSPPVAAYIDRDGEHLVEVAGIWGGTLPQSTEDAWTCRRVKGGAVVTRRDGEITIDDDDGPVAFGFSAQGHVFVFGTPATLYVATR